MDYTHAVLKHIQEGPYELQNFRGTNPVDRMQSQVKDALKNMCSEGLISEDKKRQLSVPNPRIPRMCGLPKIHKPGFQIRPVVTTIDAPTCKIAQALVKRFQSYKKFDSRSIKNSIELVKELSDLEVGDEYELISYDVKALFPSVPEQEAVVWLKEWCSGQEVSDKEVAVVSRFIDIVVSQKYFQFDGKIYKQLDGVEIGGSISPWVAEITMSRLETKLLKQPHPLLRFFRYVDDLLCILKKGTAVDFLQLLNAMHPKIQFTYEREENRQLPFLDLLITRSEKKLDFEIYRKPTDSMLCIPADSFTPNVYKMAAFESMFHRLYNIPMTESAFEKEEEYIYEVGRVNGYKEKILKNIQNKHEKKKIGKESTLKREEKRNRDPGDRLLMLGFYPPMTEKVKKIAKKAGINCVYKSQGSLGEFLINLKDKRPESVKAGVYRIKCADCEEEYIGQTKILNLNLNLIKFED